MKLISSRVRPSTLLGVCIASAVLVGAALAQPPKPGGAGGGGGSPGGGSPGGGPGGPGGAPGGPGGAPGGPGAGPGAGPGVPGAAPTPTFVLAMCNKTNDIPVIFVATVGIVGQQFRAQGWTQVPQGQCVPTGSFQRPTVWWYGRAPNGMTWGDAKSGVDLCVNFNGGFDYTWDGQNRQCGQGENSAPFMKLDIAPNVNTFTMTLN